MTRRTQPASAAVSRRPAGPGFAARLSVVFVFVAIFAAAVASIRAQQTKPAPPAKEELPDDAAKTLVDESSIGKTFDLLSDADASVRDAARTRLMGMDRRYLSVLERVVTARRPLRPSQAVALRQIVTHVYCAGEPYEPDKQVLLDGDRRVERPVGFFGVTLEPTTVNVQAAELALAQGAGGDALFEPELFERHVEENVFNNADRAKRSVQRTGILIQSRFAGFVGARLLRTGDVVLGIAEAPEINMNAAPNPFTTVVRVIPPGETIHLILLRNGRLLKVAIAPDARPLMPNGGGLPEMMAFDQARRAKADKYWRDTFAPLLGEEVG
jgi:hypothetical protein